MPHCGPPLHDIRHDTAPRMSKRTGTVFAHFPAVQYYHNYLRNGSSKGKKLGAILRMFCNLRRILSDGRNKGERMAYQEGRTTASGAKINCPHDADARSE